jgi:hypothetical protein
MKRILLSFGLVITLVVIWFGESRRFFCLEDGNCVTVWKTYNNVCYIIPGKYYGIVKPSEQHIESSNTNLISIYFSKELPNAFVFKSSGEVKIYDRGKREFSFYDYEKDTSRFDKILYMPNAVKRVDIKADAGLMDIDIREDYATDKFGKKL